MAEGIVTLAGSRLYTSAAYTEEMIDDVLARFERVLANCDQRDVVLALKSANSEVSNKLFSNMSARLAESIRDDLEITTNVRMKDVEDSQQRIVGIIRDLEEKGEIVILKGGKDDIIA